MTQKHHVQFQWQLKNEDLAQLDENLKSNENQQSVGIVSPIFSASSDEISHLWQIRLRLNKKEAQEYDVMFRLMDKPFQKPVSVQFHFEFSDFTDSVFIRSFPVIRTFGTTNNRTSRGFGFMNQISYDVLSSKSLNFTLPIRIAVFLKFQDSPFNTCSLYEHQSSYQLKLFDKYKSQKYTDLSIMCNGKLFQAHKLVLGSASPVFESLIENQIDSLLTVDDVAPEVFQVLLEFVYTGQVSMDYEKAKALLEAADKYKFGDLKNMCLCKIESNINVLTAVEILIIFDKRCNTRRKFKMNVMNFIKSNIVDVISSPAWKEILVKHVDLLEEVLHFIHL